MVQQRSALPDFVSAAAVEMRESHSTCSFHLLPGTKVWLWSSHRYHTLQRPTNIMVHHPDHFICARYLLMKWARVDFEVDVLGRSLQHCNFAGQWSRNLLNVDRMVQAERYLNNPSVLCYPFCCGIIKGSHKRSTATENIPAQLTSHFTQLQLTQTSPKSHTTFTSTERQSPTSFNFAQNTILRHHHARPLLPNQHRHSYRPHHHHHQEEHPPKGVRLPFLQLTAISACQSRPQTQNRLSPVQQMRQQLPVQNLAH